MLHSRYDVDPASGNTEKHRRVAVYFREYDLLKSTIPLARMIEIRSKNVLFGGKKTSFDNMKSLSLLFAGILIMPSTEAQYFGGTIAVTDHYVFVGETGNVAFPGEVYIYATDNPTADPIILSVNQELERFGQAVAAQGKTLFVGAPEADEERGVVYVFQYNGIWEQAARLSASDAVPGDQFGTYVALDGKKILVGAPGRGESTGAVYVITKNDDATFSETMVLTGDDTGPGDSFGLTLAVEKNMVAISAPGQSESRGVVYAFRYELEKWTQIAKLAPDFLTVSSRMGSSIMIHQERVYAGAPRHEQGRGIVLEYEWVSESNQLRMRDQLQPSDQTGRSQFGAALASIADEIWVGANRGNQGRGTVYRFTSEENRWISTKKLLPNESIGRAAFGSRIAIQNDIAVVGAVRMDSRAGGAILMRQKQNEWITEATLVNAMKSHEAITGTEIRCTDGLASRWTCQDVDMTAFLPLSEIGGVRGSRLNDIWGWTDPQTSREYALVGRNDGTSFVDITDPENPRYLGNLPMTAGSVSNVWRDIKVYANHAYIVADGAGDHGVQIFDLAQLRNVEESPVMFRETAIYTGIASTHNIVINEETGFGFVVGSSGGGETCGGGLHMLDLRDPVNVSFAGCFADSNTGRRKTGYSHDAQCVIYSGPDPDYSGREICLGSNETALSIADVTDKESPVAISVATYPNVAYTHQGWLTEDHRYFYMNDEGDEPQGLVEGTRTLIWDVSDLDDPVLVTEYIASTPDTDHNLYIRGNLMYQSNYGAGLRILDITNPETPVEIGFFEPGPGSTSWSNYPYFESGTLIVTSGSEGLFILRKRTPGI